MSALRAAAFCFSVAVDAVAGEVGDEGEAREVGEVVEGVSL